MTPTGKPWTMPSTLSLGSTPFGRQYGDTNPDNVLFADGGLYDWDNMQNNPTYGGAQTAWNDNLNGAISSDGTLFLPVTGWRSSNGAMTGLSIGCYATSSLTNGNLTAMAGFTPYAAGYTLALGFTKNIVAPSKDVYLDYALPVRCVLAVE